MGTCDLSGLWLLAEPKDQKFGRPDQNFFLCKSVLRKVDLLSIRLSLKTAVLAGPSDQYSGRSSHNS
jgi:hypothetical protein